MNRALAYRWLVILLVLLAGSTATLAWGATYVNQIVVALGVQRTPSTVMVPKQESPNLAATALRANITQIFTQFDESLSKEDMDSAQAALPTLQEYQHQILTLLPKLASDQKTLLARTCSEQINIFETDLHILPERAQMHGIMVLAGYRAIVGNTK